MTDSDKRDEQEAEKITVVEETTADESVSADESATEVPETAPKRSKSSWLWPIVILIIGGLLAGWIWMPAKNRQQVTSFIVQQLDRFKSSQEAQKSEPSSESAPTGEPVQVAAPEAPVQRQQPAAPQPTTPSQQQPTAAPQSATDTVEPQTASAAQIETLMTSIDRLTGELRAVRHEQQQLQQAMHARERLELRSRLQRIAGGDSRLTQMATDWQDILLLPLLSDTHRSQAESMRKLATGDVASLHQWQQQLRHLADSLPIPQHDDVIPKPKSTWLSWLAGQFHLRPAPMAERQALMALRYRLLNAAHALAAENWPDDKTWTSLLDEARARLGKKVKLGLPESLDRVQKDKMKMRMLAQNWLEAS